MKEIAPKIIKAAITRVIKRIQSGWTRGTWARNKYGNQVEFNSQNACRWCAVGAMHASIKNNDIRGQVFKLVNKEAGGIMLFNDLRATTKFDVIAVFKTVYDKL